MAINGIQYDWESMTFQGPQGEVTGITEISYSDERPVEPRYGKGAVPRGYGRKNYKASGSLTLDKDEHERLRKAMGGTVYGGSPVTIVVGYANKDQPTITDTLPDCVFTKQDTSGKSDDDNAGSVKLDFTILSPIKWNGAQAYGQAVAATTK